MPNHMYSTLSPPFFSPSNHSPDNEVALLISQPSLHTHQSHNIVEQICSRQSLCCKSLLEGTRVTVCPSVWLSPSSISIDFRRYYLFDCSSAAFLSLRSFTYSKPGRTPWSSRLKEICGLPLSLHTRNSLIQSNIQTLTLTAPCHIG